MRRRSALLLLALLPAAAYGVGTLLVHLPDPPYAVAPARRAALPRDPADDARRWRDASSAARERLAADDWVGALLAVMDPDDAGQGLRRVDPPDVAHLEGEILRAAGGAGPVANADALHEVFRRLSARLVADGTSRADRIRCRRAIEWASSRALARYGDDLARFAAAYRGVRFGDGDLAAPPSSAVRRLRFAEAADELERARPTLTTWCYERRLLRKVRELRSLERDWIAAFGVAPGSVRPSSARDAEASLAPRIDRLSGRTAIGLARGLLEAGETGLVPRLLAHAEARRAEVPAALRAELRALDELALLAGRAVPADVHASPALSAWRRAHAGTDVAHAVGGLSAADLGAFDEDAIDAYVAGGLLWAPTQWAAATRRFLASRSEVRGGRRVHLVDAEHFVVETDVSADFAAQASLVLDAAYEQIASDLGVDPAPRQRAVVYAHEADYRDLFPGRSGGCWTWDGTIHCFLDDRRDRAFARYPHDVLMHEAAHAVLGTSTDAYAPSWLHEGVAQYYERWDPTASAAVNRRDGSLPSTDALEAAARREIPAVRDLVAIRPPWNVDDFGPRTRLRYASAESVFVFLFADPERRRHVDRFVAAAAAGKDPAKTLTDAEIDVLDRGWRAWMAARSAAR